MEGPPRAEIQSTQLKARVRARPDGHARSNADAHTKTESWKLQTDLPATQSEGEIKRNGLPIPARYRKEMHPPQERQTKLHKIPANHKTRKRCKNQEPTLRIIPHLNHIVGTYEASTHAICASLHGCWCLCTTI